MRLNEIESTQQFLFHSETVTHTVSDVTIRKHRHDILEVYFITDGSCRYFIDSKCYELLPGDLVIIPSGVPHNTEYRHTSHTRKLLYCPSRYIPAAVRPMLSSMMYLYRNPSLTEDVGELFSRIEKEYSSGDTFSEEMILSYTHMLFFLLARNVNTCSPVKTGNEYIEGAAAYLREHFAAPISLREIAKMHSLSPAHFSRTFKKETGFSFCEYVNLLRLQKAEALLKEKPTASVTEIASECGFNDSNYFSLKFKQMYGVSPKKVQLDAKHK